MNDKQLIRKVADNATRSEKTAWQRKYAKMEKLIEQLKPLEEQILNIIEQKQPILDQIHTLRSIMVNECIHPKNQLVVKDGYVECKFCNKKIVVR